MLQPSSAFSWIRMEGASVTAMSLPQFSTPASQVYDLGHPATTAHFTIIDLAARDAVRVENDQIIANPSKMIRGLGYPVVMAGRRWWVENIDGDTTRYYRGPKI